MSSNAVQKQIDVAQLTQTIRQQLVRNSAVSPLQVRQESGAQMVGEGLIEPLHSIDSELDSLAAQLESGEPQAAQLGLRGGLGSMVKRRLYRFLWWQTQQIKALTNLVIRQGREEGNAIGVLSERVERQAAEINQLNQSIADCKRQIFESETRLQQLESAQLRLQAGEIERNVKVAVQLESALGSFREDTNQLLSNTQRELAQRIEAAIAQQDAILQQAELLRQESAQQREEVTARLAAPVQQEAAAREQLAARLSELGLYTHQTRTALSLQERRITLFIEAARKRVPGSAANDQLPEMLDRSQEHRYDSVYVAFEDLFRGSREEIKGRQSVYLPLLQEHGIGSSERPVLDLGCGRGEWLELLREQGFTASGVDRNDRMIECCRATGLQVAQDDALPYLRSLPDASLGAVTSFHMIEHLPFEVTLELVDECLRALRSGGILILETPNPQNILVGSYAFHFDPSHVKPIPSPMLQFFVEARGFDNVHVRDLHPYPEAVRFPDDGKGMANRLSDYLYGPQDYAVIGRKP